MALPPVIPQLLVGLPLAPAMVLLVTSPMMSAGSYAMSLGLLGLGWANVVLICRVSLGLFAGYVTLYPRFHGFSQELIFSERLPADKFHDADYLVEALGCECGKQLSNRVEASTHTTSLWCCWLKSGTTV